MYVINFLKFSKKFLNKKYIDYVLEYCPNGSLASELAKHGKLDEECTKFYVAEIISAVEHMHSKGIIHRDLKPDNVLLSPNYHSKLTDFGTSKIIGNTETRQRSDSFVGTEEYVSPELLDDSEPYTTKR